MFFRCDLRDSVRSSLIEAVATPWKQAGGGPAASHFSCFAKKSNQKKGWSTAPTKAVTSAGGPQMWWVPVGGRNKLATLRQVSPQFPTDTRHIWQRLNA